MQVIRDEFQCGKQLEKFRVKNGTNNDQRNSSCSTLNPYMLIKGKDFFFQIGPDKSTEYPFSQSTPNE
jgi:hypothetical protein